MTYNAMKTGKKRKHGVIRTILRVMIVLILVVVAGFGGLIGFLSITEYKPSDVEELDITGPASKSIKIGDTISVMSWNIGYGALGDNADFFMDGGKMVNTADADRLNENLNGIISEIRNVMPDVLFIQEIDIDSSRSGHVNEVKMLSDELKGYSYSFANNFKVKFLPYPIPPIGKVDSGIMTESTYHVDHAERIQLPIPFSWPVRMANLKRCILVSRIPINKTDKELVLVNLHLEAYDNGEGKIEQTKALERILNAEKRKGNYIIAGGDFNQIFSTMDVDAYPAQPGKWAAGQIDISTIGVGWRYLMDPNVPSCRSLDVPYAGADKEGFQYYLIDGFIVSDNFIIDSFETHDLDFKVSDHNPVIMKVTLKEESLLN